MLKMCLVFMRFYNFTFELPLYIVDEHYQARTFTVKTILVINAKNTKSLMPKRFYWVYTSFCPNPSPLIHAPRDYR